MSKKPPRGTCPDHPPEYIQKLDRDFAAIMNECQRLGVVYFIPKNRAPYLMKKAPQ